MYDFIIVGGSQSGLAMAYQLKKLKVKFLIVDAGDQIGSTWLSRWDSLTLFTPKKFNHLPGLEFTGPREYPNKNDVAKYLQRYVSTFNLPLQLNTKVNELSKVRDNYCLKTSSGSLECKNIIIATGPFHTPYVPALSSSINADIVQIHSKNYLSPKQLNPGATLVVGGGDSGVQILSEVADTGCTTFSSGVTSLASLPQVFLGKTLWWWLKTLGILSLSKYSYLGRQIQKRMQPVIGTDVKALLNRENVIPVGRTLEANNNTITFADTQIDSIKNIIWATGYKPDFGWLLGKGLTDLQFDANGYPRNYRGIGESKGMYFIGLPWMHTRGSATLGGVGKDADHLARYITKQYQADERQLIQNSMANI